jgi:hypothetical protein
MEWHTMKWYVKYGMKTMQIMNWRGGGVCKAKQSLFYKRAVKKSWPEGLRKTAETLVSVQKANLGSEPHVSQTQKKKKDTILPDLLIIRMGCERVVCREGRGGEIRCE